MLATCVDVSGHGGCSNCRVAAMHTTKGER